MTRFPAQKLGGANESIEPKLVQAADLIGQLGDPMYSRKANALYCEFEEIGMNRQLGYSSPADIIDKFPAFFWNSVSTHLDDGIKYLNMTVSGRQWIANMHHHILCAAHGASTLRKFKISPAGNFAKHLLASANVRFARWAQLVSATHWSL